ncbi:MAG: chemotaxis protein CheW [Negativicutes bacterium]|nr:chemotaxis protein CheW [Negativicutes bacterium]
MAEEQVVIFQLGKEEYCVPIHQVREIIQYKGATKMPGAPKHFEGIINLRGRIIPIINLAAVFALEEKTGERQALIIDLGEKILGIVVDQVSEVLHLDASAIEAPPAQAAGGGSYIRGIGKTGDRLLILLELANLVDEDELAAMAAAS